jgi:hypothetical protein
VQSYPQYLKDENWKKKKIQLAWSGFRRFPDGEVKAGPEAGVKEKIQRSLLGKILRNNKSFQYFKRSTAAGTGAKRRTAVVLIMLNGKCG